MLTRAAASWLLAREGLPVGQLHVLEGGYEQAVYRAGEHVVRVCASHRELEQLIAAWEVAEQLAAREPDLVVAPLRLSDGQLLAHHGALLVSLWPRVHGRPVSRRRAAIHPQAAQAVARLHAAAANLTGGPAGRLSSALLDELPASMRDAQLTSWFAAQPPGELLVHGDLYPGNMLWRAARRTIAVIDWDEVYRENPARELAWACWEFCKVQGGTRMNLTAAQRFLDAYARCAGGLPDGLPQDLVRWVRLHLAYEMGRSLHARRSGQAFDPAYLAAHQQAYQHLARR